MPRSLSRARFSTRPFQQSPRRANRPPTRIPDTRSRGRSIALKPRRGRIRAPWPDPWRPRTRCEEASRFGSVARSQALSVRAQPRVSGGGTQLENFVGGVWRRVSARSPTLPRCERPEADCFAVCEKNCRLQNPRGLIVWAPINPQGLIIARRATEVGARESRSRFSVLRVARATK